MIVGIASCFTIWMASSWYGMELVNAAGDVVVPMVVRISILFTAIFLAKLDRIPGNTTACTADVLLPLLNMAPEFLSQSTRDWIYSWTPLRFAEGWGK
ncbi:hypothetical protein SAMN02799630_04894 [Paenibacillus sp. UNCCL117]|nr:hypothetical protein SAMN04488602_120112 [Paenibacillus sp. cl123]SFW61321.1 hypothetical protein SAMN02799630_04894 [Paenibacillus sp. UNCCL117]